MRTLFGAGRAGRSLPGTSSVWPWSLSSVRQSTPQQVLLHPESTRLHYGLVSRAAASGWASDRIVVIDDDLGKSGATAVGRVGFERLVTAVSLGHVGPMSGPCRAHLGPGEGPAGPRECRPAPPARSGCPRRHGHRLPR